MPGIRRPDRRASPRPRGPHRWPAPAPPPAPSGARWKSISRYSDGEWSLPPMGPSPSIDATPMPAVVLASEAPPVAASLVGKPRAAAQADRVLHEARGAGQLLHGPVAAHHVHLAGGVRHGAPLRDGPHRRLHGLEVLPLDGAHVHLDGAALGDHVGARAAADDARVDRDSRPAAVERMQRDDLMRRLQQRGAALLRFHARVRGAPRDAQLHVQDALAGAHEVAVGAGALEHQRRIRIRRQALDHRRGHRRPDLLVGIGHEDDPAGRQPRARVIRQAPQHLERVQARQQTTLHVRHTRAVRDAVRHPVRPLGDGARSRTRYPCAR